jgi:hypothetical protein
VSGGSGHAAPFSRQPLDDGPGNGSPSRRLMPFTEIVKCALNVQSTDVAGATFWQITSKRSRIVWRCSSERWYARGNGTGIQLFSAKFTPLSVACESAAASGRAGCHHVTGISGGGPGNCGLNDRSEIS